MADAELREAIENLGKATTKFKEANERLERVEKSGEGMTEAKAEVDKWLAEVGEASKIKEKLDTVLAERDEEKREASARKAQIETLERSLEELAKSGKVPGGEADELVAAKAEFKKAFAGWMRRGAGEFELGDIRKKAFVGNTISDPEGGFAVPEELDRTIIEYAKIGNPMRTVSGQITVSTPKYYRLVSVGGATSGWVGELDNRIPTDPPKLARVEAKMGELYAEPACTEISLQDSFFDFEDWYATEVAYEFARQENRAFTVGDGVNKPLGLFAQPTGTQTDKAGTRPFGAIQKIAGAVNATFTGDELIDLIHATRSEYRANGRWMATNLSVAEMRKLKDNDGNYLWRPGLEEGASDSLLGYALTENEDMAEISDAAGAVALAFGDFARAYQVVDILGTGTLRDPFTLKGSVKFYTTKRVGNILVDPLAVKLRGNKAA